MVRNEAKGYYWVTTNSKYSLSLLPKLELQQKTQIIIIAVNFIAQIGFKKTAARNFGCKENLDKQISTTLGTKLPGP